jgi:DNA segregation ATPase FtsK/SpoIIIE, S-DNA-T family
VKQSSRTRQTQRNGAAGSRGSGRYGGRGSSRPVGKEFRALGWVLRHPGWVLAPLVLAWALLRYGLIPVGYTVAALVVLTLVWGRAHPASFDRWVAPWLRSTKRRWWDYHGRRWADVLIHCDLSKDNRRTGAVMVPRIDRVRAVTPSIDTLRVRMVRGQDMRTWTDQSEALAHALGVERVAVTKHRPGRLHVVVERDMPFTSALPAPEIPATVEDVNLRALDIGDDEYGQPMTLPVIGGSHPLVAGASNSGKSGVMWGLHRAMGPMIREGLVRVRMIDLKGGTETELGRDLFYRRATTMEQAVELLREGVEDMQDTQRRMNIQRLRKVEVSPEFPLDFIPIDELAMLTAYGDRQLVREAIRLLALLMTQGRSSLFSVAGFVQEPSKDIVEVRELFTSRICLGVTAASHVDMVLGEGALDRGALAHEIPLDEEHAGIGFRMDKGTRLPRRLRVGHTTDADVIELNQSCAPGPHLVSVPTAGEGVA